MLLGGVSSIENLRLLVAQDLVWLRDQVFPRSHLQVTVLRPREAQLIVERKDVAVLIHLVARVLLLLSLVVI